MAKWMLRILDGIKQMEAVEALQHRVWPGSEIDIVPAHMLLASSNNGGLVVGAFAADTEENAEEREELAPKEPPPGVPLIGFVFGFPGIYRTPDGPRAKHYSHMLGVHPDYRGRGVGFALKRAQWQMVRHQGLDRITWTYDPLLSRNAYLNIARLGAVCNTYKHNYYGEMRDELNQGLPSDRFVVDWWVNSKRVGRRLSNRPRLQLDLAHFLAAGAEILNPSKLDESGYPAPGEVSLPQEDPPDSPERGEVNGAKEALLLVEIPADFQTLKAEQPELAREWRMQTREIFETLFGRGYLITDFIHLPSASSRSFYVLSHGESTLS